MNVFKKAFCVFAAAAIAVFACGTTSGFAEPAAESSDTAEDGFSTVTGYSKMLSDYGYELYFDGDAGEIALHTPQGKIWYSNPQGDNIDELAQDKEQGRLRSQIVFNYYVDQSSESMSSYSDSVSNQPPEVKLEDGVLSVRYSFGKEVYSNNMLPTVISKERMERDILPKLTDEERELVLSRYSLYERDNMDKGLYDAVVITFPVLADHDIYARGNFPDYVGEEIYAAFERIGYTLEDLERDCEENGVENTYEPPMLFSITLDYELNENGLRATVDPEKITYNTVKPVEIEILPFFGCTGTEDTGYMLVPDGSGAIINFNNGKTNADSYSKELFGGDKALTVYETGGNEQSSLLPVFALSKAVSGFLAVIDSGFECASVNASVSGKTNVFNNVYASFEVTSSDLVTVTSSSDGQTLMTADNFFSEPLSVEYIFTDGYTDYSRFAQIYREYLKSAGTLGEDEGNSGVLNVELVGTALTEKSVFGISYNSLAALTDFSQADEILDELSEDGVYVKYSGAVNGGKRQKYSDGIDFAKILGGRSEFAGFSEQTGGVSVAMNIQNVLSASKGKTVKMLNRSIAKQYEFDPVSRYILTDSYGVLISPSQFGNIGEKLIKDADKNGIKSLLIKDVTKELNSDFDRKNTSDRAQTRTAVTALLSDITGAGISVESSEAGVYALPYISRIWDIPTSGSGYYIEDASVPFYAMVVRGSIPYTTQALNTAPDLQKAFLEAVEIGAGLQFSWIYQNAEDTVNADEKYYGRIYTQTLEEADRCSDEYRELYEAVKGSEIVSHSILDNGVRRVEYDNGITVYVNYSDKECVSDGINISPESFAFSR